MKKGWRKLKKKKSVGRKRNETKQSNRYTFYIISYCGSDNLFNQNSPSSCIFNQIHHGVVLKKKPIWYANTRRVTRKFILSMSQIASMIILESLDRIVFDKE